MEKKIISRELVNDFVCYMKRHKIWILGEAETKEMKTYLRMFAKFILEEYDNVQEIFEEYYEDIISEICEDDDLPASEKALRSEINKMLDSGRA